MKVVNMYSRPDPHGGWSKIGPGMSNRLAPGSIQSTPPEGNRQVYVFGFMDDAPGVWRSKAGVDVEGGVLRAIISAGLDHLSDLSEPYETDIWHQHVGLVRVRFVLEDEPDGE